MTQRTYWGWAIGILLVLIVVVMGRNESGSDNTARVSFINGCREFVRGQLKAPATADFSPVSPPDLDTTTQGYRWIGSVDSENSFGANLRTRFTCEGPPDNPSAALF